jgi:hypothetical protein
MRQLGADTTSSSRVTLTGLEFPGPIHPAREPSPQRLALLRVARVAVEMITGLNLSYAAHDAATLRQLQTHALAGSPTLIRLHPGSE